MEKLSRNEIGVEAATEVSPAERRYIAVVRYVLSQNVGLLAPDLVRIAERVSCPFPVTEDTEVKSTSHLAGLLDGVGRVAEGILFADSQTVTPEKQLEAFSPRDRIFLLDKILPERLDPRDVFVLAATVLVANFENLKTEGVVEFNPHINVSPEKWIPSTIKEACQSLIAESPSTKDATAEERRTMRKEATERIRKMLTSTRKVGQMGFLPLTTSPDLEERVGIVVEWLLKSAPQDRAITEEPKPLQGVRRTIVKPPALLPLFVEAQSTLDAINGPTPDSEAKDTSGIIDLEPENSERRITLEDFELTAVRAALQDPGHKFVSVHARILEQLREIVEQNLDRNPALLRLPPRELNTLLANIKLVDRFYSGSASAGQLIKEGHATAQSAISRRLKKAISTLFEQNRGFPSQDSLPQEPTRRDSGVIIAEQGEVGAAAPIPENTPEKSSIQQRIKELLKSKQGLIFFTSKSTDLTYASPEDFSLRGFHFGPDPKAIIQSIGETKEDFRILITQMLTNQQSPIALLRLGLLEGERAYALAIKPGELVFNLDEEGQIIPGKRGFRDLELWTEYILGNVLIPKVPQLLIKRDLLKQMLRNANIGTS